ncbi:MAG: hypothetical protein U0166_12385 [Acidobacteriota bacterium]
MIESHVAHMVLYAAITAVLFSLLARDGRGERIRYALKLFALMTAGSIALAWLMYPFPRS